jgi:hypothetical protein
MSKLDLKTELAAVDSKDRDFYDSLSEDERKKFSPYILLRYAANVEGNKDLQEYYLLSANRLNRDFWSLNRHPKLQWLSVTAVSPGVGNHRHYWIKTQSEARSTRARRLAEIYPNACDDELAILEAINTDDDLRDYDEQRGEGTASRGRRRGK